MIINADCSLWDQMQFHLNYAAPRCSVRSNGQQFGRVMMIVMIMMIIVRTIVMIIVMIIHNILALSSQVISHQTALELPSPKDQQQGRSCKRNIEFDH